jgi:hypothetical protein
VATVCKPYAGINASITNYCAGIINYAVSRHANNVPA